MQSCWVGGYHSLPMYNSRATEASYDVFNAKVGYRQRICLGRGEFLRDIPRMSRKASTAETPAKYCPPNGVPPDTAVRQVRRTYGCSEGDRPHHDGTQQSGVRRHRHTGKRFLRSTLCRPQNALRTCGRQSTAGTHRHTQTTPFRWSLVHCHAPIRRLWHLAGRHEFLGGLDCVVAARGYRGGREGLEADCANKNANGRERCMPGTVAKECERDCRRV